MRDPFYLVIESTPHYLVEDMRVKGWYERVLDGRAVICAPKHKKEPQTKPHI